MRNLGSVLWLLLIAVALQGNVTATLSSDTVKRGEPATLSLRIEGARSVAPKIERLCGVEVDKQEVRRSIEAFEKGFAEAVIYTFTFRPESDCMIEPIALEVDGIESYTPPLRLKVTADASSVLELRSARDELYVGEPFELEAVFNKGNAPAGILSSLTLADMEGFWVKKSFGPFEEKAAKAAVTRYRYILVPQQSGVLRINPAEVKLAVEEQRSDAWGNPRVERYYESYYSNTLEFYIKPLPDEVVLVGDYTIELTLSKKEVAVNRPLNAVLSISGVGNFEDIALIKPEIGGVNVFAGEPEIVVGDDGMHTNLQQELVFVAENNYTVPPIRLDYFDPKERRVKRIETEPVPIHVIGAARRETVPGSEEEGVSSTKKGLAVLFVLGLTSVVAFVFLSRKWWRKTQKRGEKGSKDDYRYALRLLLAHRDEPDVEEMIMKLEASLYDKKAVAIDHKALHKLLRHCQK